MMLHFVDNNPTSSAGVWGRKAYPDPSVAVEPGATTVTPDPVIVVEPGATPIFTAPGVVVAPGSAVSFPTGAYGVGGGCMPVAAAAQECAAMGGQWNAWTGVCSVHAAAKPQGFCYL